MPRIDDDTKGSFTLVSPRPSRSGSRYARTGRDPRTVHRAVRAWRVSDEEIAAAWRGEVLNRVDEVRRGEAVTESYSEVKGHLKDALDSAR